MACKSCGTGCGTTPAGCNNNGNCGTSGCNKLDVFDWLVGMSPTGNSLVEVRFKNTRKEFFKSPAGSIVIVGEAVAVEAQHGYDVGVVSLTGELVAFQMKKRKTAAEPKKILRKATESDVALWREAQALERETLLKARKIIAELKLNMKLSDVEYQGDKSKATFYYISEERVDFRELIKRLADTFRVKVDMRQIGPRQEAGRVGGLGVCGRELCCSSWLTDFRTVSTTAARYQQLSINPIKLAGQCGKLKCCLNYELDSYLDAIAHFPDHRTRLKTKKGSASHQKSDIFKGTMWYAYDENPHEFIALKIDRVKEIIGLNKQGTEVESLENFTPKFAAPVVEFGNVVGQDSLTRFDKKPGEQRRSKNKRRGKNKPRV